MIDRRAMALAAVVVADISLLVGLRLAGVSGPVEFLAQLVLVVAFAWLAFVDLRAATAIVVLELALAGASGRWTVFPGGISGRIALDAIVFGAALWTLYRGYRAGRRPALGRYTVHALVVAVLLAGIWIPLGIANGWRVADAWGDGNGYLFFAFTIVLAAVAMAGDLGWLRRWLLVACSATAVLTVALAALALALMALTDESAVYRLRDVLLGTIDQGGAVSMLGGNLRIALGSGLYLPVGVGLLTWEIVDRPRRVWPWLLMFVFAIALLASYTRAFWLGAAVAAVLVVVIGLPDRRRLLMAAGATALMVTALTLAGWAVGFSLPNYVATRIGTAFILPEETDNPYELELGVVSNAIKVHQARVLLGHIAERPVQGWGFGAIAPDYRYGQTYSYELSYIALAYKTGLIGLLIFFSFPLRLVIDGIRGRLGRLVLPVGVSRRQAAVPVAVLVTLLLVGATNPFLVASFGLAPVVLMVAWLDPFGRPPPAD